MKVKSIPMAMTVFASALVTSLPVVAQEEVDIQAKADKILESAKAEGTDMSRKEAEKMAAQAAEEVEAKAQKCWVTEVLEYNQGNPAAAALYSDPSQIIGPKNAGGYNHEKALSLGNSELPPDGGYGEVVVSFGKNFIADGYKLYLYETGTDREDMWVQVRDTSGNWHPADPGKLVQAKPNPLWAKKVQISDLGAPPNTVFDAVRIRDVEPNGNVGASAAGADIDAVGIDCAALPVKLDFVDAILTEEGVVVTWRTGFEEKVAEMQLWRAPLDEKDNPIVDQAALVGGKYPFHTQNYFVLDNETLLPGRYGYAVMELNDDGTTELHQKKKEIAVIEVQ